MKVIGVIGFSNSGKTSLILQLVEEFQRRDKMVVVIKHSSDLAQVKGKDTEKYMSIKVPSFFLSDEQTWAFWKGSFSLENLLSHINAEIVIVEGYKQARSYPRIVCVNSDENADELFAGIEIAQWGKKEYSRHSVPLVSDVSALCDLIEEKAFKLPDLNCGQCGHLNCHDFAKAILEGKGKIESCEPLFSDLKIWIDGREIPMNRFVQNCFKGTVTGFLSALKGVSKKGKIKIEFE